MKIALLYDVPASLQNGRLHIDRGYGIRVDALAGHFEQIVVCNPIAAFDLPQARYELRSTNVSVEPLPYFARVTASLPLLPQCAIAIWRASRSWSLLHITLPTPLGIIGYLCARARGIPTILSVVGDLDAQYERGRYRGISGLGARAAVKLFEYATHWMIDRVVTITQGEALCRKYKRRGNRVTNIPWSPISQNMIVPREDTCLGPRIRLLFVGALLERKGIFVLLESAKLLLRQMDNFVVTYIGDGPLAEELARRVQDAGLSGHVVLRGGVYKESDLWREFDAADIFVFPTYAEGFPRVIFEAMARGLPVVSTRVSGIPGVVKEGQDALLVTSGSPHEVVEAVTKVVRDATLRQSLIRHGHEVARAYTLEKTTKQRVEAICSVLTHETNGYCRQ